MRFGEFGVSRGVMVRAAALPEPAANAQLSVREKCVIVREHVGRRVPSRASIT